MNRNLLSIGEYFSLMWELILEGEVSLIVALSILVLLIIGMTIFLIKTWPKQTPEDRKQIKTVFIAFAITLLIILLIGSNEMLTIVFILLVPALLVL